MPQKKQEAESATTFVVKLSPESRAKIEHLLKKSGVKSKDFFAKLLEFFARQDDVIRGYMLDQIPESIRVDVAELILRRIAEERPPSAGGDAFRGGGQRK